MKLTIEPTAEPMQIDGVPCRLWTGTDENGTPVDVYVRAVSPQTHDPERLKQFEERLKELPPLRQAGMTIDYRFIVD
jgi:hypothetical protein